MPAVNVEKRTPPEIAEAKNIYTRQIGGSNKKSCCEVSQSPALWCGDSAVEIGSVVREYDGKLFCVDWWKGNVLSRIPFVGRRELGFKV